jgi:hypothetical protein
MFEVLSLRAVLIRAEFYGITRVDYLLAAGMLVIVFGILRKHVLNVRHAR